MAFFSKVFNVIKKVGKPILNSINAVVQSLDDNGRQKTFAEILAGIKHPIGGGMVNPFLNVQSLDGTMRPLDAATDEERQQVQTIYAAEQAHAMNVILNEIPFFDYKEYEFTLTQSFAVTVPSQTSLIQTIYANPLMNLGGKLINLAAQFEVMRVNGISLCIQQQNEFYSTRQVAYSSVIKSEDREEMLRDLEQYYENGPNVAENANPNKITPVGAKSLFFYATDSMTEQERQEIQRRNPTLHIGEFSQFVDLSNKITTLENSSNVAELERSTLVVPEPTMRMLAMKRGIATNPVYCAGMEYISLDYTDGYYVEKEYGYGPDRDRIESLMPVYGKFYFYLSNRFEKAVDQIVDISYSITCRYPISSATYTTPF